LGVSSPTPQIAVDAESESRQNSLSPQTLKSNFVNLTSEMSMEYCANDGAILHRRSSKCHLACSSVTAQLNRVCLPVVSREKHFWVQHLIFSVTDKIVFPLFSKSDT
jgi:hypothetical protein